MCQIRSPKTLIKSDLRLERKSPVKKLQNDLAEGRTLAGTEIKIRAMQVFDKTAMPPKESNKFMEYGQEHIDVLAFHYFQGDEVSQAQLQAEWKLIKY